MQFLIIILWLCWISGGVLGGIANKINLQELLERWIVDKNLSVLLINEILEVYVPVSDYYDNDLCRNHSLVYKENLKNLTVWALRMLDSGSKIPEGFLMGNLVELGDFDECLSVENVETDYGPFSGKHCIVDVSPLEQKFPESLLGIGLPIMHEVDIGAQNQNSIIHFPPWKMQLSVCVPSSCRASDVETHLQNVLYFLSVNVNEITCNSRTKTDSLTPLDLFAIGLLIFFATLVILSTTYDLICPNKANHPELLVAYSVYTNGRKLLNGAAGKDSLSAVHGVRCLSMMWVVLFHRYKISALTPSVNVVSNVYYVLTDWCYIFFTNGTVSVDSFLLISGILVSYVFLKEIESGAKFDILTYYCHRYIRLTPAFAVMILLTITLMRFMGDGPFWNTVSENERAMCLKSWWASFLYVNNYVNVEDLCLGHSWYLAVDMQLFWLSPLFLLPLWKCPKLGKAMLVSFIGIGILTEFLVAYINEYEAGIKPSLEEYWDEYDSTHTRFTPWLIGVGLGYILHKTKHRDIHMSPFVVAFGWIMALGLLMTSLMLRHRFMQPDHHYERIFESVYKSLMRPFWALGLAWIIFACVKGYGGFINTFLSWKVFLVLGRLAYTMYLVHVPIIKLSAASSKILLNNTDVSVFHEYFGDLAFSLAAAVVLSLVCEVPILNVQKALKDCTNRPFACCHTTTPNEKCISISFTSVQL